MEGSVERLRSSLPWRLMAAIVLITVPVGISVSWLSVAYQTVLWRVDFASMLLRSFFTGAVTTLAGAFLLLYPLERWIIGQQALVSYKWILVRILLYILSALPAGVLLIASFRLGTRRYPLIIESSGLVIAVANAAVLALAYTFLERTMATVSRREARLQKEITTLQIEIDSLKQEREVAEITETDYFRSLQAQAQQLREQRRQRDMGTG